MAFITGYSYASLPDDNELCIFFKDQCLFVLENANVETFFDLPRVADLPTRQLDTVVWHYLGEYLETACYVALEGVNSQLWESVKMHPLRDVFRQTESELAVLINLAFHVYNWDQNSRYCSRCGSRTVYMKTERGKECEQCRFAMYPVVSPCVIVAIVKDNNSILLAEMKRGEYEFYSVLAGFVEAGETLEQAVAREVKEEVGIAIKNIQYFASQPWSFSQSLMIGFTAEYDSGEIAVDGVEVHVADWFQVDTLPNLPSRYSIARELIEWFKEQCETSY